MHICPQEFALIAPLLAMAGYALMRLKHAWHWIRRHKRTADEDGCCDHDHSED